MNNYELVIILDEKMPQDQKDEVLKQAKDSVTKEGGKVTDAKVWLEKHRMTFDIKKCSEATYCLINFESEPSGVAKIKQNLKLNEKLLRYAIYENEIEASV